MKYESILSKYASRIEEELKLSIGTETKESEPMYDMMRYFFGWQDERNEKIDDAKARGKRFRPSLCLLANESLGGNWQKALPAATTLELFHNFTLIHDDIEDHDEFRRHRLTLWKVFGIEQAINCGDAMFSLSFKVLFGLKKSGYSTDLIINCLEIMQNTYQKIVEGQYMDISFENRSNVSVDEYIKMTENKTSVLVGCACQIGAFLATNNKKLAEDFYEFGLSLGMAYQIYDDWSGIWEKTEKTGKKVAGDIRKKKKTIPVLFAFENLLKKDKEELAKIYQNKELDDQQTKRAIEIISKSGAEEYTIKIYQNYKKRAQKILNELGISNVFIKEFNNIISLLIPDRI